MFSDATIAAAFGQAALLRLLRAKGLIDDHDIEEHIVELERLAVVGKIITPNIGEELIALARELRIQISTVGEEGEKP